MNFGGDMESENYPGAMTQVTGWQEEAATARGSQGFWWR